jgi:hypothetical protein
MAVMILSLIKKVFHHFSRLFYSYSLDLYVVLPLAGGGTLGYWVQPFDNGSTKTLGADVVIGV